MESTFRFHTPPSPCGYLPNEVWRLDYEGVGLLTPEEYEERLVQGWRRFGSTLFRPRCPTCQACQSVRVLADRFRPNRSQRRCRRLNEREIQLRIGVPSVTRAKLDLHDRYHTHQTRAKGWPIHPARDAAGYADSFVNNPFAVQEWCYWLGDRLMGVGYVDDLPGGLSAIYFFYDPDSRDRSLGTWNVLSLLEHAAQRKIPHLYLGYFVPGCRSMEYKTGFSPNQVLGPDGQWRDFR
jgi:arginyl-tRNA--protein-N-Asp/Glu arginylyltransferase